MLICVNDAVYAAGNFPIGFSASGTPTSLQVVGPPGFDSIVLSLLTAMEKLFGNMPAPPFPSLCQGCVANITNRHVSGCAAAQPWSLQLSFAAASACISVLSLRMTACTWLAPGLKSSSGQSSCLQLLGSNRPSCHVPCACFFSSFA